MELPPKSHMLRRDRRAEPERNSVLSCRHDCVRRRFRKLISTEWPVRRVRSDVVLSTARHFMPITPAELVKNLIRLRVRTDSNTLVEVHATHYCSGNMHVDHRAPTH